MPDSKEPQFDPNEPQWEIRQMHRDSASVEITKENLWKNDHAKRKEFADKIAIIIEHIGAEAPAVILLDGKWGTGKTHFLKSFRLELEGQGYKSIYFDAFTEDFSSDPLLAICGQLQKNLENGDNNVNQILNGFIALSKGVLRHYGVDTNIIKEVHDATTSKMLKEYVESRENLDTLKGQLSTMVTKSPDGKEGEAKPLVFIIDELDRCRPTFSLELLERVKHLFQVPGIIFILGANKKSIMNSVKSEYGNQDPEYLQKFFDLELKLPNSSWLAEHMASNYDKFITNYDVLNSETMEPEKMGSMRILDELYYPLINLMRITPRQAQRIAQMLLHCLAIPIKEASSHKIEALICLILLKVGRPKLYKDIAYRGATCKKITRKMHNLFKIHVVELPSPKFLESIEECHLLFNRAVYLLAEGKERQKIEESKFPQNEYVDGWDAERWDFVKNNLLDRDIIVSMLENLDRTVYSRRSSQPIQL